MLGKIGRGSGSVRIRTPNNARSLCVCWVKQAEVAAALQFIRTSRLKGGSGPSKTERGWTESGRSRNKR